MGFKMKGFNPGKGTGIGNGFPKKSRYIEDADYKEKMKRQKELESIEDPLVTSYDKQEDRPLYQRDYMNLEGRKNLPGSYYQSASSVSSFGDKNYLKDNPERRDHSAHDAYSGVKDKAAGYDIYSLGAKGAGDEFASEEVKKRNAELRKEAVYNTREANAIGRYKNLEKSYGKGNVPDGLIPDILKEDGARPEFLKKRLKTSDASNISRKEMRQQRRQERRDARRDKRRNTTEDYTPQSSGEYTDKYTQDMDRMIEEDESKKRQEKLVESANMTLRNRNRNYFQEISDDDDEYIPQTQIT